MKTFARVLSNPDQPDDMTVIEIAQAEEMWDLTWAAPPMTWLNVEVTGDTGLPHVGDFFREGKFVRLPE